MNSECRPRLLILCALGVLIVSALLFSLVGHGDVSAWPANSVHNWEQYGLGALHGKLVINPGGFEALTKPATYIGHRATSFYPVFAVSELLGWAGDGLLMFHLVFSGALFFAAWFLLGRSHWALVGAVVATLCPGYSVYPTVVDPNAMALYLTVPFAALVTRLLAGESLSPQRLALLALLTFAYSSLNWSTVFGHGILFCTLLVLPAVTRKRLGIYTVLAGLSVGIVGVMSVLDKVHGGAGPTGGGQFGGFQSFLSTYTWGHSGYGEDMTFTKAIVRLGAVNTLGLFPLLAFTAYLFVKCRQASRRLDLLALLPFLAAVGGVLTLRNYFAHHPWMAAPMLVPGLVLSLAVLLRRNSAENIGGKKIVVSALFLAGSLCYAVAVLGAHRFYHAESLELTALVRHHTQRADIIVLVKNLDPQMAEQAESLADSCDRHVVLLPDLNAPLPAGANVIVLSATNLGNQFPVVARSEKSALLSLPFIKELSAWYAQKIARRGAQDHHFDYTVGATFGLYRLSPPAP